MNDFSTLGLSPSLLKTLHTLGFTEPTPIQRDAIPHALAGRDIMGLAQTGTGKTAAFGLPLIEALLGDKRRPEHRSVRSLILAPTRELAAQIADHLRALIRTTPLSVRTVVGGASINMQMRSLDRGADILVATPGRLLDLVERNAVSLAKASFLVLDEADQMLDLGFIHALRRIAKLVGSPRQTLLFSATMPKQIEDLSRAYLKDPVRIEVAPAGTTVETVRQSVHFVDRGAKTAMLRGLLGQRPDDLSLVFARTKHGAEKLMKQLAASGFAITSIHGNKSQGQRERAIKAFRSGEIRVLVATDIAARGIDIPGVSHVYNFDLPEVPESYIHRIGRTARAGAGGDAVAFCAPDEAHLLRAIEKLMGMSVPVASGVAPGRFQGERHASGRPGQKSGGKPARNGKHFRNGPHASGNGKAAPHAANRNSLGNSGAKSYAKPSINSGAGSERGERSSRPFRKTRRTGRFQAA